MSDRYRRQRREPRGWVDGRREEAKEYGVTGAHFDGSGNMIGGRSRYTGEALDMDDQRDKAWSRTFDRPRKTWADVQAQERGGSGDGRPGDMERDPVGTFARATDRALADMRRGPAASDPSGDDGWAWDTDKGASAPAVASGARPAPPSATDAAAMKEAELRDRGWSPASIEFRRQVERNMANASPFERRSQPRTDPGRSGRSPEGYWQDKVGGREWVSSRYGKEKAARAQASAQRSLASLPRGIYRTTGGTLTRQEPTTKNLDVFRLDMDGGPDIPVSGPTYEKTGAADWDKVHLAKRQLEEKIKKS